MRRSIEKTPSEWKDWESIYEDRLMAQRQPYDDNFIVITYPTKEQIEEAIHEEYNLLQQLKQKRYGITK
jgi:hypothetical protein